MRKQETLVTCPECNGEGTEVINGKVKTCSYCEGMCEVPEDYDGPIDGTKIEHFEFEPRTVVND